MSGSRLRGMLLAASAVLAGLVLLAWSQPWFTFTFTAASGDPAPLQVGGDVAASGLAPLALTVLAVVAALALAGPVFRAVFGVLEALVGAAIVAVCAVTLGDPVASSASAITEVTGESGHEAVAALVASTSTTAWPTVAIVLGVLVALVGALVVVTGRRWPVAGRRYSRTRTEAVASDPIAEWDALSDGDDPTAPSR
ncbi:Trp biosynthesis-associated membrane protein [Protaetiibacter intestinalis]|uniref:Peptidase n=1 Tax=Protaetiibacter intestinalis TaxID=2419774 RepID=A0A387B9M8_9MICO|nr:Trp biosynthesis-associated membrane protein [Protaetiibacter intestinalis]AYF99087.1 hypothetical protein D7I47_13025 [Protaetiibacter intestinalis]